MHQEREFDFTDQDFRFIQKIVLQKAGIVLSDVKRNMVYGRLSRRLRALDLDNFGDYCDIIRGEDQGELGEFINAITTNLTSFFREPHHFEFLSKTVLPELTKTKVDKRIRIWSAGCSTGEEPYSLAITLHESIPKFEQWDVKILATDLDTNVVAKASSGMYDEERVSGMSAARLKRWFSKGRGANAGLVKVARELQDTIMFKQLNLMEEWPMKGPFDVIFCRNVVIYFNKETQKVLFDRYADIMVPNGHLCIGHSESLYKVSTRFTALGKTIYRRSE